MKKPKLNEIDKVIVALFGRLNGDKVDVMLRRKLRKLVREASWYGQNLRDSSTGLEEFKTKFGCNP